MVLPLARTRSDASLVGPPCRRLTESIDTSTPAGRVMFHILGAMAQFERDLIAERTASGMKAARERGVKLGREPILTKAQRAEAQKLRNNGRSLREIANRFGVSTGTIQNWTTRPKRRRT